MNDVKFNVKANPSSPSLILMVFRYGNGKKLVMSTSQNVPHDMWDKRRMRVRQTYGLSNKVNQVINTYAEALVIAYQQCVSSGKEPTSLGLKRSVLAIVGGESNGKSHSLLLVPYLNGYIKRVTEEGKLSPGTIQGFRQLLNTWLSFSKSAQMELGDLDIDTLKAFQSHMTVRLKYSLNQCEKLQRKLVTVLNYACKADKLPVNKDYEMSYWKVSPKLDNIKIYYSNEEIMRIRDYPFEEGSRLDRVRDRWILGFATGQRYSDFKSLSKDDVRIKDGKKFFEVRQKKTGILLYIPIYNDIERLLEKYDGYLSIFSDQKFNEYIKEVAREIGFTDTVTQYRFVDSMNTIKTTHEKWELTTSHVCRRSFATNGSIRGLSLKYLMNITGHKKPKAFLDYVQLRTDDLPMNLPQGNSIFL